MKRYFFLFWLLIFYFSPLAQDIEYLGLSNKHLSSLKIGYGIIAVGSNNNGVYWQQEGAVSDTGWKKIDIDSINVTAVYPHKSGPIGWAIGIGTEPNLFNAEFLFCSFLGEKPKPMSYGIDTIETWAIAGIDGFPDPTICGETFAIGGRKLYRRFFQDTVWHSVKDLSIEGNFSAIKAREENQYVYAGGAEGFAGILLIRSTDKGDTWEDISPLCMVQDLDFYGDSIHKIIVTDGFKVLLSKDHGNNWSNIFQTDSLLIQNISYSSSGMSIYIVANTLNYGLPRTYFFMSQDDGSNWEKLQLPVDDFVAAMDISHDNGIYLAFINSGVIRFSIPIVQVEEEIKTLLPEKFILYQNYPNPFNPTTKIRYTIPNNVILSEAKNLVTLKIYDVLGNEIATLVNEPKPAGGYEVEFDGSKLSSGIYYYQLKAENYLETKKMILIK